RAVCSVEIGGPSGQVLDGLDCHQLRLTDTGRVHPAQLLLQLADLVAQPGGDLELQLASRAEHLVVELLDQVGQLRAGQLGDVQPATGVRADSDDTRREAAPAATRDGRLAARLRAARA